MLTSSRFAPPRTCSSATSTALLEVVRLDEPAELRGAGDVRPLAHDHEARVRADHERLEAREARQRRGLGDAARRQALDRARDRPRVLRRRAAAAADEVDETVLGERAQEAARVRRLLVVQAERVRKTRVRMAGDVGRSRRSRGSSRNGRISVAPSEQLTPTMNGSACSTEIQKASEVWPERLRPLLSTAVNESQSGTSGATVERGDDRGLRVQRVEDRLDQEQVDAAVARERATCSSYVSRTWSKVTARYAASSTRGESESVTLSGPTEPATKRGFSGVRVVHSSAARRARRAPSRLISAAQLLERVVGLPDPRRREGVRRRDVRARIEVGVVDLGDDLRLRQVQEIGIALDVARVLAEALAPVLVLGQLAPVDEHAPGPVEHEDALGQKAASSCSANVLHENDSRLKRSGAGEGSRAL